MPTGIKIPKLGLTMTEATLVGWSVGTGETLATDQTVCVIETDKVSLEVPSPAAGLVHPVVEAGRHAAVGEVIGYIAEDEKALAELQLQQPAVTIVPSKTAPPPETVPTIRTEVSEAMVAEKPERCKGERIVATPAAHKRSRELDVDLAKVAGSGPRGRIVLADEERVAADLQRERSQARYSFLSGTEETELLTVADCITIRGVRKIISKNMKLSLSSQAQLTLHTEASAREVYDTRALFNAQPEEGRTQVSYNAILVKAAASALRHHPMLNAAVDGREIKIWKQRC